MRTYAKCSALLSAINLEKFQDHHKRGPDPLFVRLLPMSVARNKALALVALSLSQSPPARTLCCVVHLGDVRVSRVCCVYVGWGYYVPSPVR